MFRIGTTSYIIPADILPNVEYLAPQVDDVELVLFESDGYGDNLPDAAACAALRDLAAAYRLTYTVHLPLDLHFAGAELDISLQQARRVIEATRPLGPYAYVLHLDGRSLAAGRIGPEELAAWQEDSRAALETLGGWLPDPGLLCVENLEAWDPEAFAPVIEALPVGRTIDVGHFWLNGKDPLPHLARWIDRARVIHLHGIAGRDHASLACVPPERLDPVVAFLSARFAGVVTLEVFDQVDLATSLQALQASVARSAASR